MGQKSFTFLFCALALVACGEQTSGRYGGEYQSGSNRPTSIDRVVPSPSHIQQSAAILLPMTGPRADLGQVLLQAAKLAMKDDTVLTLDILDTTGQSAGASTAAAAAVAHGDSMILGPLTSLETASVAPIARAASIPVLAYTNDSSQSQAGVWPLGISSSQQIQRLVAAAQARGRSQFAALLPDSDFGHAMATALMEVTDASGLRPPTIKMHAPGMAAITAAAKELSDYADRRGPIEAQVKAARALGTTEGRHQAQELLKSSVPPPPFDVLLLADTGDALQEIAAILPYYDVDRSAVQIIGPALWADPASGSGAVPGAWYAAPDSETRGNFVSDYTATYGVPPSPVADLAFDSASVAKAVFGPDGANLTLLTQPGGFVGVDGWFMLRPDGQVKRNLAVYRLEPGGPEIIDPAPQSIKGPGL